MIKKLIEWSAKNPLIVVVGFVLALSGSWLSMKNLPLDAIPDLSETQVIVHTEWMGRSPDLVEDQVTYPIVSKMISAPNVKVVRGITMFSQSFVYVIFDDGTDPYWARSRVLEYMSAISGLLPPGVDPVLGPDATSLGWVFQYALEDKSGSRDLAELRTFQDFNLRYALESVQGVAEVASFGGFEKQFQVELDPKVLLAHGITLQDVSAAIRRSSGDVGGRVIEMASKEYYVRGKGYIKSLEDIENVVVKASDGTPLLVRDIGSVMFGGDIRRGAGELNGEGEAVGGVVIMRYGENALDVIEKVKERIVEIQPSLPEGVKIVATYDRSSLIERAIDTLKTTLLEEGIVVSLIIIIFLLHFRSAFIPIIALPIAVLLAFIPMKLLGVTSNIMSLGGIAIAIGAMVDASIVMVENAHKKLEHTKNATNRGELIIEAAKEVGPAIFFSLLIITAAFLPVFALTGQAGKLFHPLAYTKTFAMFFSAVVAVTLAPVLMRYFIRGKIFSERRHPVSRFLIAAYTPLARTALKHPLKTMAIGLLLMVSAVPAGMRLGSEFMPPLDEGDVLYMPTTLPGVSIEEAKKSLQIQDRILKSIPEVATVHGKVGRAQTATDPAPLSMVETVIQLKPREEWRTVTEKRFYSDGAPELIKPALRFFWPEERPMTMKELVGEMDEKVDLPGWTDAWIMPIKTRIDMLTTGIRTPVGIKILGPDLEEIARLGLAIENRLGSIEGVRSVYAERSTGGHYIDIIPDREKAARYGLNVSDIEDVIATSIGGNVIGVTIDGRDRFSINVRYPRGSRDNIEALKQVLVARPSMAGMTGQDKSVPYITLGQVADISITKGPPMIKDEDGMLAGYVFIDVDTTERDIGGFVKEAKKVIAEELTITPGYRLNWTGQYELMTQMQGRMKIAVPLALVIILLLLYFNFRSIGKVLIVLLSLPFALVGSVWLMHLTGSNLSTATWVGIIALLGLAAETGIIMIVYLDIAYKRKNKEGGLKSKDDIMSSVIEGAAGRVRPKIMTVMTTFIGLLPLLWATGSGADVMRRLAIPLIGGLFSSTFLTLIIIPVIYMWWRVFQLRLIPANAH